MNLMNAVVEGPCPTCLSCGSLELEAMRGQEGGVRETVGRRRVKEGGGFESFRREKATPVQADEIISHELFLLIKVLLLHTDILHSKAPTGFLSTWKSLWEFLQA